MIAHISRHAIAWLLVAGLAACAPPSAPEQVAQATPAPAPSTPIFGPWMTTDPEPDLPKAPPPEPVEIAPIFPPDSVYGDWIVTDVKGEKGVALDRKEAAAWIGSQLHVTKALIKLDDPPAGIRRFSFPASEFPEDVENTCTNPTYRTDLENAASDLSADKVLYRHFGLPKPADAHVYLLECNPDDDDAPDADGHIAELSREEIFGLSVLFSYAPDTLFLVWSSEQIIRLRKLP